MRYLLALAASVLPALACADILHMADGTTREGRVVEITEKEVVVDCGHGSVSLVVRVPRSQVVRIEEKAAASSTLMADYLSRLAKATKGAADDWHALGVWCREQRCLNDKATEAFERAIALSPDHTGAHLALGHVKLNDAWMPRKQALRVLAPEIDETAKLRELATQKQLEELKTQVLEAQKRSKELEGQLADLKKENQELRLRLATPLPFPLPPRVIYRPIIVVPTHPRRPGDPDPKNTTPPTETPPKNTPPRDGSPR
jgi:hypothetical protein